MKTVLFHVGYERVSLDEFLTNMKDEGFTLVGAYGMDYKGTHNYKLLCVFEKPKL